MARSLRIEFAGAVYYVTSRGNARQDIVRDDTDLHTGTGPRATVSRNGCLPAYSSVHWPATGAGK